MLFIKGEVVKNILCESCNHMTASRSSLRKHIQSKHTDTMFFCDQCKFKAVTRSALQKHSMQHNETNWFHCEYCEFQCARKRSLQSHMDHKHIDSKYPCPRRECEFVAKTKIILRFIWVIAASVTSVISLV